MDYAGSFETVMPKLVIFVILPIFAFKLTLIVQNYIERLSLYWWVIRTDYSPVANFRHHVIQIVKSLISDMFGRSKNADGDYELDDEWSEISHIPWSWLESDEETEEGKNRRFRVVYMFSKFHVNVDTVNKNDDEICPQSPIELVQEHVENNVGVREIVRRPRARRLRAQP